MLQSITYFDQLISKYWTDDNYFGYVYLIYDQKHKLSYVGQKWGKIEDSLDYFGSGSIISNIQNKRGTYFLKKIILGVCYSEKELTEQETECKHFFNVLNRKYGYNILEEDTGGDTFTNNPNKEDIRKKFIGRKSWSKGLTKETDERVKKISEKQKGKKLKESTRQQISNSVLIAYINDPTIVERGLETKRNNGTLKRSDEYKKWFSKTHKGENHPNYKIFSINEKEDIINKYCNEKLSLRHIGRIYNENYGIIKRILLENSITIRSIPIGGNNSQAKKIINLDTEEKFNSIIEAACKYNVLSNSIIQCCKGKREVCTKGFHWQYYNE
jgi:hypothetical protein